VAALPGIPTIRPFEALACGIPLVSAPWQDAEHLFHPGADFLFAHCGSQMREQLEMLLAHPEVAQSQAASGLKTIQERHTCRHRVDELLEVIEQ
jgi:spore maturation protein CgeB